MQSHEENKEKAKDRKVGMQRRGRRATATGLPKIDKQTETKRSNRRPLGGSLGSQPGQEFWAKMKE